jgi:diguanylate cyclase (GGDEF)-like protein
MVDTDDMAQRMQVMEQENRALRQKVEKLQAENRRWARLVGTDLLTGLPNKISFLKAIVPQNLRQAAQHAHTMGFILLSADDLGPINEAHGRAAGDEVLKGLGSFLKSILGQTDHLGHMDGSHFSVVSMPADINDMRARANMLRARVRAHAFPCGQAFAHITISAGIAVLKPLAHVDEKQMIDQIYQQLNSALYTAKASGGNQVQAIGDFSTDSLSRKEASL